MGAEHDCKKLVLSWREIYVGDRLTVPEQRFSHHHLRHVQIFRDALIESIGQGRQ